MVKDLILSFSVTPSPNRFLPNPRVRPFRRRDDGDGGGKIHSGIGGRCRDGGRIVHRGPEYESSSEVDRTSGGRWGPVAGCRSCHRLDRGG